MAIPKLSLPAKLNDPVLRKLSIPDHCKYLYLYNKYRGLMDRIGGIIGPQRIRIGFALDWFRQVNYLAVAYTRSLCLDYLHDTWPAGDWPDSELSTVRAFEYAFHKQWGSDIPGVFYKTVVCMSGKKCKCVFCGREVPSTLAVLRLGLPSCAGCRKPLTRPVRTLVVTDCSNSYLDRLRSRRGRTVQMVSRPQDSELVMAFLLKGGNKDCEMLLKESDEAGLTTLLLEEVR